jgi:hypothetical protein
VIILDDSRAAHMRTAAEEVSHDAARATVGKYYDGKEHHSYAAAHSSVRSPRVLELSCWCATIAARSLQICFPSRTTGQGARSQGVPHTDHSHLSRSIDDHPIYPRQRSPHRTDCRAAPAGGVPVAVFTVLDALALLCFLCAGAVQLSL